MFRSRPRATSPGSPPPTARARILGLAAVVASGLLAVPAAGWLAGPTGAQAMAQGGTAAHPSSTSSCVREIEGTTWLLDPCIPEGAPLPQDILDALEQARRDRCVPPTTSPVPTSTSSWSPPPTSDPTYPSTTYSPPPPMGAGVQSSTYPPPTHSSTTGYPSSPSYPPPTSDPSYPPSTSYPPPTSDPSYPPSTTTPVPPTTTPPTSTPPTCEPSPTPTTPPTSPPTSPPVEPTDPLPPPPPPSCVYDGQGGAPRSGVGSIEEARSDRIECRDRNTIPDRSNPIVFVATGDSLTSAHHQFGFGDMCQATSFDRRMLTGNHATFSYAGRYFAMDPNIIEYYNFARTGFGTGDMLGAGAATADACGNAWGRGNSPVALADTVIRKAKADGHKAYYVTTGGVNNTNWTAVLSKLIECRGMEFMQQTIIPRSTFNWAAVGGRAGIVTNGGSCILRVSPPWWLFQQDWFHRIAVPPYNGVGMAGAITADVGRVMNTIIAAGADKIVWMLYYDLAPANVDIANFGLKHARARVPGWVADLMPVQIAANNQPLIDPMWVGAVRGLIANLNAAITAGVPANPRVRAAPAPGFLAVDIQNTAIGGSPHPSAAGHTKLANTLAATYRAI
jgi:hypothetical protein